MIVVNTTGRACPESVAMTRAALDKGAEELEVLVDNPEAATNVKRLLEDRGFRVLLQDDDGESLLLLHGAAPRQNQRPRRDLEHRPNRDALGQCRIIIDDVMPASAKIMLSHSCHSYAADLACRIRLLARDLYDYLFHEIDPLAPAIHWLNIKVIMFCLLFQ